MVSYFYLNLRKTNINIINLKRKIKNKKKNVIVNY